MKEPQENVREYLAGIGRRGGLASRRDLTRSHAKQTVAIRERRSLGRTLRLDGDTLGKGAGHRDRESRQAVATA